jgi:hypothetical protein
MFIDGDMDSASVTYTKSCMYCRLKGSCRTKISTLLNSLIYNRQPCQQHNENYNLPFLSCGIKISLVQTCLCPGSRHWYSAAVDHIWYNYTTVLFRGQRTSFALIVFLSLTFLFNPFVYMYEGSYWHIFNMQDWLEHFFLLPVCVFLVRANSVLPSIHCKNSWRKSSTFWTDVTGPQYQGVELSFQHMQGHKPRISTVPLLY